ncbi:hypothetical protein ACOMICROBIO_LKFPLAJE_02492 [Vibrio sp. B1FIG11]|nr:hypothetical protein ACOMICROBIO_LKFPLAJE_02492 [Vibrio sp. B1FIG11]
MYDFSLHLFKPTEHNKLKLPHASFFIALDSCKRAKEVPSIRETIARLKTYLRG